MSIVFWQYYCSSFCFCLRPIRPESAGWSIGVHHFWHLAFLMEHWSPILDAHLKKDGYWNPQCVCWIFRVCFAVSEFSDVQQVPVCRLVITDAADWEIISALSEAELQLLLCSECMLHIPRWQLPANPKKSSPDFRQDSGLYWFFWSWCLLFL